MSLDWIVLVPTPLASMWDERPWPSPVKSPILQLNLAPCSLLTPSLLRYLLSGQLTSIFTLCHLLGLYYLSALNVLPFLP